MRKKKIQVSEEKFLKCEEGEKNVSVEFRVFGKKMKEKFGKKNQSVSVGNFLLSSCSLVGLYVNLQVTKKSFWCGLPR